MKQSMKSGLGIAAVSAGDFQMTAVVIVNALGDTFNPQNGLKIAGLKTPDRSGFLDSVQELYRFMTPHDQFTGNTTIGAVITNGAFSKAELNKIASMTAVPMPDASILLPPCRRRFHLCSKHW